MGLILDSSSELLLDQYSFYKGSDLSFIAISTNWPSLGRRGGGISQLPTFSLGLFINACLSSTVPIISQLSLLWARVWAETLTARLHHDGTRLFSLLSALCSPAYLSEHVDHVDCSAGRCARGVINGMMQRPVLLHPGPHMCTPPSFIYHFAFFGFFFFVSEICLGAQRRVWVPEARLTDANIATCALDARLCVCACVRARSTDCYIIECMLPLCKQTFHKSLTFLQPTVVFIPLIKDFHGV